MISFSCFPFSNAARSQKDQGEPASLPRSWPAGLFGGNLSQEWPILQTGVCFLLGRGWFSVAKDGPRGQGEEGQVL